VIKKMTIADNIHHIEAELGANTRLIAVTKTKPIAMLMEAYEAGFKRYGENKVQEMVEKHEAMPKDIEWHLIGHLQTNKVKYMAHFVAMIHSVDSLKLLQEINKQAAKHNRTIDCLLQIYIAQEETKFGLEILNSDEVAAMQNIRIVGLMGMASNTDNQNQVRKEFKNLKHFFDHLNTQSLSHQITIAELSMGMSGDYLLAAQEGSTLVRVGSAIFGSR
jgi:pyridoxal phosphate enzyme (YggS family)